MYVTNPTERDHIQSVVQTQQISFHISRKLSFDLVRKQQSPFFPQATKLMVIHCPITIQFNRVKNLEDMMFL